MTTTTSNAFSRLPQLAGLLVFMTLFVSSSRECFPRKALPAFCENPPGYWVELGEGFPAPGVYQFPDGVTMESVIQLTLGGGAVSHRAETLLAEPLVGGERLSVLLEDGKVTHFQRSWMTAAQRMTLRIPLHPDRMTRSDWTALPGVGVSLAKTIDMDRQINGEFGGLDALKRVRGVGAKRIARWRDFF